jgi:hypothetical protein
MYELYIEGFKVDIDQKISVQLSFAIDDVANFSSRETGFSKTIILPGTGRNNQIFGYIYDLGSFNYESPNNANIGSVFNVAQTSRAELRLNGLLVLKGVFRITNIVKDKDIIEYEGALFGEMSGFIAQIGNSKLEQLNFSEYNHSYTIANITSSWDIINGSGYYYPLIDYGTYSEDKINYDYRTLRPALYVKEYIDKIFEESEYTYESDFFNSSFFKKLIIPNNSKELRTLNSRILQVNAITILTTTDKIINFDTNTFLGDFTTSDNKVYTYNGVTSFKPVINLSVHNLALMTRTNVEFKVKMILKVVNGSVITRYGLNGNDDLNNFDYIVPEERLTYISPFNNVSFSNAFTAGVIQFPPGTIPFTPRVGSRITITNTQFNNGTYTVTFVNTLDRTITVSQTFIVESNAKPTFNYSPNQRTPLQINLSNYNVSDRLIDVTISTNTQISIEVLFSQTNIDIKSRTSLDIKSQVPILAQAILNDDIIVNDSIAKNILQKDFFVWIIKMFNLYITEDRVKDRHLIIEPYVDYYGTDTIDWTYKVDRSNPWQIKPMGMLNSRFLEYKFKEDNDFYNEGYKKKYNLSYGDRLEDTGFQYAKDKQTVEIGFSSTPIIQYDDRDKYVSAILKRQNGNAVDQEQRMDSNIRILMAKKMTGVATWNIKNGFRTTDPNLSSNLTTYGYAGHFDDPLNPTKDINFGAASEIYFDPNSYTSNNLFNDYWSEYISEIADKDSKILSCYVHLTPLDIAQLDFSKAIMIDGIRFRLNKIEDFDYTNNELVKVELLKIINNG